MSRLRVGFDVTSAARADGRGIAAYVSSLLRALADAAPHLEPVLFVRGRRWLARRHLRDLLPDAPRRWLLEPVLRALHGVALFHGLGVRLPARCPAPRSFTLHDLRGLDAVQWTDPRWVRLRAARLRQTVSRADAILCLTEHGRQRLAHHFPGFPLGRTAVVPHGMDHGRFRPLPAAEAAPVLHRHRLARPYLLQVGRLDRHKNPEGSLRALALCRAAAGMELVFAGGAAPGYEEELAREAGRLGIRERVRWLGSVRQADLPAIYGGAAAVLVPSHYEGFGLPVLEAMACGCAGLVSSGTCLPEVAGSAWPSADPASPEGMAAELERLLGDGEHLARVRAAARSRAAEFTWERCARSTAAFLAMAASLPAGAREG